MYGDPVGIAHSNPLLDTRKYQVEFDDGTNEIITANIIAENILSQVDEEGHTQMLLSEIVDHRTDGSEVKNEDGFIETRGGGKRLLDRESPR